VRRDPSLSARDNNAQGPRAESGRRAKTSRGFSATRAPSPHVFIKIAAQDDLDQGAQDQ